MLWRISPKRSRRTPPAGFILPCQPLLVDRPPAGSGWLHAVKLRSDGHSDFAALRTKAGSARACLVAFDLLSLNGADLRQRPLEERRDELFQLVHGVDCIVFSEALSAEGALV